MSLRSGARVEDALAGLGHEVVAVDVGARAGRDAAARSGPTSAFVALHGPGGEDGTVQELLEILGIPYTGPGAAACGRSLDKAAAKHELRAAEVPTPDWVAFNAVAFRELGAAETLEEIERPARLPAGDQAGGRRLLARGPVRRRRRRGARGAGRRLLLRRPGDARAPRRGTRAGGLAGRRDRRCRRSRCVPRDDDRYNYEARYEIGRTDYVCPAELGAAEGQVLDAALRTWDALGFDGFARVDMILGAGRPRRCSRPTRSRASPTPRCCRWRPRRRGSGSSGSATGCSSWRSSDARPPSATPAGG